MQTKTQLAFKYQGKELPNDGSICLSDPTLNINTAATITAVCKDALPGGMLKADSDDEKFKRVED